MNKDTSNEKYSNRLFIKQNIWWKRLLNVQAPYRWNIKRLGLGFTLDIGCGIGRNLLHLDGNAVGVDHNPYSVEICRNKGLRAYTAETFLKSEYAKKGVFDSLLLSHLIEHIVKDENIKLIKSYLLYLKQGGRIVFITPQPAGYRSDPTHVWFADFKEIEDLCGKLGLIIEKEYSFPFPKFFGSFFKYNEHVVVARKK